MSSLVKRGLRKVRRIALAKTRFLRSPLRVALVGFGEIAIDHLESYEDTGAAVVVAVSDVRPAALAKALDRRPALRAYRDYREMLREVRPDAISVCTWPDSHAEIVSAAAELGVKGVLCEKPLALQLGQLEDMLAACQLAGTKLACGHQYRFHPHFVRARDVLKGGRLGKLTAVRGHIKSTLANNGPHLIDTVRFLLGDVPAVRAFCRCDRVRGEVNRSLPAEDAASGEVVFAGDIRLEFRTGDLAPSFFAIEVEGAEGKLLVTPEGLEVNGRPEPGGAGTEGATRGRQFSKFLAWVKGRLADYAAHGETAARTAELVLALYESARVGCPVGLPLQNKGDVIHQLYPEPTPPAAPPQRAAPAAADERLAMDGGKRAVRSWFSSDPAIGLAEMTAVAAVLRSKQLNCVDGHVVRSLEQEFARVYGVPRAVASTSGTAAIHVALGALNPNPGDEIITTPVTDMGSVIPILLANCIPVFADLDPVTGNLTAETIARRLSPRTKAVILVHLFGHPADLGPICGLLRERNVALIEDCAQAHYADYRGKKVGTYGDFGCFSLQQSKQITCGDGGLTLVNRPDLAERAALFVDKGWDRKHGLRAHRFLGANYRMTELQAAVALAQLRKLPRLIEARREGANRLTELLRRVPGVLVPEAPTGTSPSWWTYPFAIDEEALGVGTREFCDALAVEGVRARAEYVPQPVFEYPVISEQKTYGDSGYPFSAFPYERPRPADFPGFQAFSRRLVYIPWSHNVLPRHVTDIAAAVRKVVRLLPPPRPAAADRNAGVAVAPAHS